MARSKSKIELWGETAVPASQVRALAARLDAAVWNELGCGPDLVLRVLEERLTDAHADVAAYLLDHDQGLWDRPDMEVP